MKPFDFFGAFLKIQARRILRARAAASVLTAALFLHGLIAVVAAPVDSTAAAVKLLPLKLSNRDIVDGNGRKIILHGVNAAGMEWTSDGQGRILTTVETAIREWHVNVIRLPLTQDRWFGKTPGQNDAGAAYRALVHQAVELCALNRCYVILDLHWSDCNEWGTNIGQHSMPDKNSLAFWKDFAPVYANHPAVIFDLYNEPHDVSWETWLKGGRVLDKPNNPRLGPAKTFDAVGMQDLLNVVRECGATNLVIAGGLDWAYDFSGILAGAELSDPKVKGVIYASHCYDNKKETVYQWIDRMEAASATVPVIVSEFGGYEGPSHEMPSDNWLLHVMQALQDHHWSWLAWDMHPKAGPALISDWNYTPTEKFGIYLQKMLNEKPINYVPPGRNN